MRIVGVSGWAALLGLISLGSTACLTEADTESEPELADTTSDELAVARRGCSGADFVRAFDHFDKAVGYARTRLRGVRCELRPTVTDVTRDLVVAVEACALFRDVLARSPWGAPIRKVLDDNLSLPLLTGKLDPKSMRGLEQALGSKVTVYGWDARSAGLRRVDFRGDSATLREAVVDEGGGNDRRLRVVDRPATWSVDGRKVVVVTRESRFVFTAKVEEFFGWVRLDADRPGDDLFSTPNENCPGD